MRDLDPDQPIPAELPRARITHLNELVIERVLIPLSLMAFWLALIGSMIEHWAAH